MKCRTFLKCGVVFIMLISGITRIEAAGLPGNNTPALDRILSNFPTHRDQLELMDRRLYGDDVEVEIPPVYLRPLDEVEGPRIVVKEFVLTRLGENSELAEFEEQIILLLEQLRIKALGLDLLNQEGFTPVEVDAITKFMALSANDMSSDPQVTDYLTIVEKLRDERFLRSGLTIGQIQNIANLVTKFYREQGFFIAQAIVPQQDVTNGIIEIMILEGTLGDVYIEGNKYYSDRILRRPFKGIQNKAVIKSEVESALLYLGDNPGLAAYGTFKQGTRVGETDIVIRVQQEIPYTASLQVDNHSAEAVGDTRSKMDFNWNNALQQGDILRLSGYSTSNDEVEVFETVPASFAPFTHTPVTYRPDNSRYYSYEYEFPLPWPGLTTGITHNRNTFGIGGKELASFDIEGESSESSLFIKQQLLRGRTTNISSRLSFKEKSSKTLISDVIFAEDNLATAELSFTLDNIDGRFNGINTAYFNYTKGLPDTRGSLSDNPCDPTTNPSRTSTSTPPCPYDVPDLRPGSPANATITLTEAFQATGEYDKYFLSLSRLQSLNKNQFLLLKFNWQKSPDFLTSLEQASLGGPDNIRAYPVAQTLKDNYKSNTIEYIVNAPFFADSQFTDTFTWGQVLQTSLFLDRATGVTNLPDLGVERSVTLTGWGAAIQFNLPGSLLARLEFSETLRDRSRDAILLNPQGQITTNEEKRYLIKKVEQYVTTLGAETAQLPTDGDDRRLFFKLNYTF